MAGLWLVWVVFGWFGWFGILAITLDGLLLIDIALLLLKLILLPIFWNFKISN